MFFNNPFANGLPNPNAGVFILGMQTFENLKNALEILGLNPDAVILDPNSHSLHVPVVREQPRRESEGGEGARP